MTRFDSVIVYRFSYVYEVTLSVNILNYRKFVRSCKNVKSLVRRVEMKKTLSDKTTLKQLYELVKKNVYNTGVTRMSIYEMNDLTILQKRTHFRTDCEIRRV